MDGSVHSDRAHAHNRCAICVSSSWIIFMVSWNWSVELSWDFLINKSSIFSVFLLLQFFLCNFITWSKQLGSSLAWRRDMFWY